MGKVIINEKTYNIETSGCPYRRLNDKCELTQNNCTTDTSILDCPISPFDNSDICILNAAIKNSLEYTDKSENKASKMSNECAKEILKGIALYSEKELWEARYIAVNIMRKYQKIQAIINHTDYLQEDMRYRIIREVIEDENDN